MFFAAPPSWLGQFAILIQRVAVVFSAKLTLVLTLLAFVLMLILARGITTKATYQPTTSTISSSTPKIDSKRNLSKSGTLSFLLGLGDFTAAAGSGSSSGASSWLSSCNVSMPSALGGGVVIGPG